MSQTVTPVHECPCVGGHRILPSGGHVGLPTDGHSTLSVIGIRTFRTATNRHLGDATSRAQNAGYAIVLAGAVHVATPGVADRARLKLLLDTLCGLPQPVWATSLELTL